MSKFEFRSSQSEKERESDMGKFRKSVKEGKGTLSLPNFSPVQGKGKGMCIHGDIFFSNERYIVEWVGSSPPYSFSLVFFPFPTGEWKVKGVCGNGKVFQIRKRRGSEGHPYPTHPM